MTTVALVFHGNSRRRYAWSGIPAGLANALEQEGIAVRHVRAGLPRPLDQALQRTVARVAGGPAVGTHGLPMGLLRSAILALQAPRLLTADGALQLGSGFSMPAGGRYVTYEDMTVVQALSDYPDWRSLPERTAKARIKRQRRIYTRAVACCTTTRWVADSIVGDYGIPKAKVHVVGIGRNRELRPTSRDWTTPRFLFVGNDWERKGGFTVLEAFHLLRRTGINARLDVVGGHPELSGDGVIGHGQLRLHVPREQERLDQLFEAATCFVMPSQHEPSAIAYTEAAAAGIPSIGTSAGGSADIIGPGGVVVDPGDADQLCSAMLAFTDPARAAAVGQLAAERAALYTWPAVSRRIVAALGLSDNQPGDWHAEPGLNARAANWARA